jgi:hypothetical protein
MNQTLNIKINVTGGLVAPTELLTILEIARKTAVEDVSFGARQQLLLSVPAREMDLFSRKMNESAVAFDTDLETHPNITSSFAFADILQNTEGWVSEGAYLDIFSLFDYKPQLKINICDSSQSHTPFFTGHLNFIASEIPHFWFCYVRFPKSNTIERFSKLVYTQDIAVFAKQLEANLLKNESKSLENGFYMAQTRHQAESMTEGSIFRQIESDLTIPRFVIPYYEGVNRQSDGKLWLGIYRRNDLFPVNFLIELCQLCEETRIGTVCITNWRSLIIKGIAREDRFKWERLLGKYGINVRHANNELNWQTEDDSPKGRALKHYLVKKFDAIDVRTFGLVFAIKTRHKSEVFGSVIIRREPFFRVGKFTFDPFSLFGSYDIFYAEDFNPHTRKRKTFRTGVAKSMLADELLKLTKKYYAELTGEKKRLRFKVKPAPIKAESTSIYHRCRHCWTIFDAHTEGSFAEKETYSCPICDADKTAFEAVHTFEEVVA